MIYQTHPIHGRHMAQNHLESSANEKAGWKTVTEAEFYAYGRKVVKQEAEIKPVTESVVQEPATPDDRDQLAALYESKLGKKPHHRMSIESIKAAIDGNSQ